MRKAILILVLLMGIILCISAETGVVEFKYYFTRVVENTISDIYFTDINKNRISAYEINLDSDLTHPQIYAVIYTNKTSSTPYSITLSFTPLTLKNEAVHSFWGQYQAKVCRLIDNDLEDISGGTVTVNSNPDNTYSASFAGDYSSTADVNVTCYYPISFYFEPYLESYGTGSYEGTIRIEAAAT